MNRVKVQTLIGKMKNWGVGLVPHFPASNLRTLGAEDDLVFKLKLTGKFL